VDSAVGFHCARTVPFKENLSWDALKRRNMGTMKKFTTIISALLVFVFFPLRPVKAASTPCIIVHRISGCDYFMVQTRTDYAILEWFGDHDPDKGDMLIGNISSFGMKTIHDDTTDDDVRVYVEDFGLNKTDALEKLIDHCE
jgi:hypothetical protein